MRRHATRTLLFPALVLLAPLAVGTERAARADTEALPAPAPATPPPGSKPPAKPKAPGELVSFQVEDADLPDLVKTIGELTGKRFVVATAKPKTLKATVYSTQKVTVDEAYRAFLSLLAANGLTVLPEGGLYKIVESQDAARQTTPIVPEAPAEERYVTRLHRLAHATADDVAAILAKLSTRDGSIVTYAPGNLLIMTDTGTNVRRLLQIVQELDVGGAPERLFVEPVYYAASTDIAKKLEELLDLKKKLDGHEAGELHVSRLVAFERPNALAIVATEASYRRVVDVLRRLDIPVTSDGQVHVVALQHADAKKIVGPLNEALGATGNQGASPAAPQGGARPAQLAILESSVKVSADETTNSLLVTSSPRDFAAVKAVIDRLDLPKRQVYIEAVVMEVSAENDMDLGVAWHGGATAGAKDDSFVYGGFRAGTSAMVPTASDLQAFALGIRSPEIPLPFAIPTGTSTAITSIPAIGAFITAMAQTRGADILSTPQIVASDNTPAELKVQLRIPLTPHAPAAPIIAGGATLPQAGGAANLQAIGPRIKVTPHMNDSNEVRIDIEETISDVQSVPDKADVYGSISFIERSATTTLTVKDGETMVIAGLVRNRKLRTETKVPLLGDIPLLGALFRTSSEQNEKSNLVLVLTPHIMRDDADKRRIFQQKMDERQEMIDHAVVFSGRKWTPPVDYSRARGLVHVMRAKAHEVDVERKLEELRAPREVKDHTPSEGMDLPVPVQTWGTGASRPAPAPAATPAAAVPVRVEK
jgi:general secretion pathway protein D